MRIFSCQFELLGRNARRLVRHSLPVPQSLNNHLTAKSEPWSSARPRLGASVGLAIKSKSNNLILKQNNQAIREPRPARRIPSSS